MTNPAPIPPSVTVRAGHVQPLWAGHPWVFRQAVDRVDEGVESGDEVLVIDPHGKVLGRGFYSSKSAIAVRIFTSGGRRAVDAGLLKERIERAVALRRAHGLPAVTPGAETTGGRLIHGEGDGIPGLVVDAFADVLVVQFGTVGLKRRQAEIVQALVDVVGPRAIIDRTPHSVARQEGFEPPVGDAPTLLGDAPETLAFHERGLRFEIPFALGQKTGFYFDQRPLRERIEALSRGSRVLDAFCYVGAIGLSAARGGASEVWAIDTSAQAIEAGAHQATINKQAVVFEAIDAQQAFKRAADQGGYDVVICDPPKMPAGRRPQKGGKQPGKPSSAYRKLAASAVSAVKPGGMLAFCSCTGRVSMENLQLQLALGARDVRRRALIVDRCFQGADHPVQAAFPEGLYLKVLLARIEEG